MPPNLSSAEARVAKLAPGSPAWNAAYSRQQVKIAILMGRFFVGHIIDLYRAFDGDILLAVVLGEIGHHNVARWTDSTSKRARHRASGSSGEAEPELIPCNALSLSQSTGIPRETIRRKINALVKRGWLRRNARGEVFVTPAAGEHFGPDFNRATLLRPLQLTEHVRDLIEEPDGRVG